MDQEMDIRMSIGDNVKYVEVAQDHMSIMLSVQAAARRLLDER